MRRKLTTALLKGLRPKTKAVYLFDSTLVGFGVKVHPSGTRSFFVHYRRSPGTPSRRVSLGQFPALTVDQARRRALALLGQVDRVEGKDPVAERRRATATVRELADRFLREEVDAHFKPGSAREVRRLLDRLILPALGRKSVAAVTHADVLRMHTRLKKTPTQANRAVGLLRRLMNLAERWELRPEHSNPTRHVRPFRELRRERYLSGAEFEDLGKALGAEEDAAKNSPDRRARHRVESVQVIRLLALTGCRVSEVLSLRWEDVDFDRGLLALVDSKTGPRPVQLNPHAQALLQGLPRDPSGHVFPGRTPGEHRAGVKRTWERVRTGAGLGDLRLHDLRHSFASVAAGAGVSLYLIGGMLGHSQPATTQRYAHLADDPLRQAAETTGARVAAALEGKPDAQVIELRPGGAS